MFREYPYLNLQDLNLDYILRKIREMQTELNNFVVTNAIEYADPIDWNITKQYKKNTVVIDANTGIAYLSVQPVPSGVSLSNTDYWTVIFDLSMFIVKAAQNFTNHYEANTTTTATFASDIGDWLVWNEILYKAKTAIDIGDAYVVNANIEHITIEEVIKDIINYIDTNIRALNGIIGDLNDLNTSDKSNVVNAINSLDTDLRQKIDDDVHVVDVKIDDLADLIKENNAAANDMGLGVFFTSNDDIEINLYLTNDGKRFTRATSHTGIYGRDPSLLYYNNKFYIAYTYDTVPYQFGVYVSDDLRNWSPMYGTIISNPSAIQTEFWAPQWFVDDDDIYLILSVRQGNNFIGDDGDTHHDLTPYIAKCRNLEDMEFDEAVKMNLSTGSLSYIDAFICKYTVNYLMFIKKEGTQAGQRNGAIQIFTSTDLENWTLYNTDIFGGTSRYEGPSVIMLDNKYYLYADNYGSENGSYMQVSESADLISFTQPEALNCAWQTRHGEVIKLSKATEAVKINSAVNAAKADSLDLVNNTFKYGESYRYGYKYVRLCKIKVNDDYKSGSFDVHLYDYVYNSVDSLYHFDYIYQGSAFIDAELFALYENRRSVLDRIYFGYDNTTAEISIYYYCPDNLEHVGICANISNITAPNSYIDTSLLVVDSADIQNKKRAFNRFIDRNVLTSVSIKSVFVPTNGTLELNYTGNVGAAFPLSALIIAGGWGTTRTLTLGAYINASDEFQSGTIQLTALDGNTYTPTIVDAGKTLQISPIADVTGMTVTAIINSRYGHTGEFHLLAV